MSYYEHKDPDSDYLIYSPNAKPSIKDNWLLDTLLYSQEFSADKSSVFMNDLGITNTLLKPLIENHIKFFSSKKRIDEFIKLNLNKNDDQSVELSMLWVITMQKSQNFDDILRKVFLWWFENNCFIDEFEKYDLASIFWKHVRDKFACKKDNRNLKELFISFVISNITFSGSYKLPSHLKVFEYCSNHTNVFMNGFMNHKSDYKKYREYSDLIEVELELFNSITHDLDSIKDIETVSWVDKTILVSITSFILSGKSDYDKYIEIINARKTKHWYDMFEDQYEAILNAVNILKFKEAFENWFNHITAREMFEEYSKEYYKMDSYYRCFNYYYDKAQISLKDNYLNKLQKNIEWVYTNWYLEELSKKWIWLLSSNDIDNWFIDWVSRHTDFYEKEVKPVVTWKNSDRLFVIISDALRFECWKELAELLEKEKWTSSIWCMQWVLPSYTKLWMASLLPHKKIDIDDKWRVLVDGKDSTSTVWRNNILNNENIPSVAITWKELSPYTQTDARELFKDKKVIYIYHNIIDSTWDDAKTEHNTFKACNNAIIELRDIVKKITNSWNWVNVMITADHWFIYKKEALVESDKIALEKIEKIDNSRRFIISKEDKNIDGTIKVNMGYIWNPWLNCFLPNWNSRYKIQWWWSNFVHNISNCGHDRCNLNIVSIPPSNFSLVSLSLPPSHFAPLFFWFINASYIKCMRSACMFASSSTSAIIFIESL